jgi:hypothetical protein
MRNRYELPPGSEGNVKAPGACLRERRQRRVRGVQSQRYVHRVPSEGRSPEPHRRGSVPFGNMA